MLIRLQNQNFFDAVKKRIYYNNGLNSTKNEIVKIKEQKKFTIEKRMKIVADGQSGNILINDLCLKEGISPETFQEWSQEFLTLKNGDSNVEKIKIKNFLDDEKYKIVLEGRNGEFSIAEICRRENISHEQFLNWSNEFLQIRNKRLQREKSKDAHTFNVRKQIVGFSGKEVMNYFESFIDVTSKDTYVSIDKKNNENSTLRNIANFVCLSKINDVRHINKHFEMINEKLPQNGIYIGCLESFKARKLRLEINSLPVLNEIYFGMEFLFKRILPKLSLTKKYYFSLTKGKDRLMSKAEGLGRLVSCGFKVIDFKNINGLVYFVVIKVKKPSFDLSPSYGPIYKMPRLGKNGKIIKVYKLRTMHPYSEYLQDYVLRANGYAKTGKPAEDFRIPTWGKFMRKFWLDELPQLLNVLKGEMKLVGIRPVSERYFQDIPKEMQKLRLTQKPGCIPPYVALNREGNVMSVLQSEKDYLQEKIINPYTTDIKYFFKAIFNILFKHKRSA